MGDNTATQQKRIEDYLHLYLGCELVSIATGDVVGKLDGVVNKNVHFRISGINYESPASGYKLILRPLSDMSEEEKRLLYAMGSQRYEGGIVQMLNLNCFDPFQTVWLLSLHIDLFGLIEAGLAIDKTTLK